MRFMFMMVVLAVAALVGCKSNDFADENHTHPTHPPTVHTHSEPASALNQLCDADGDGAVGLADISMLLNVSTVAHAEWCTAMLNVDTLMSTDL